MVKMMIDVLLVLTATCNFPSCCKKPLTSPSKVKRLSTASSDVKRSDFIRSDAKG